MTTNVNRMNQNNNYGNRNVDVNLNYSAIKMGRTTQGTADMGKIIPVFMRELIPSQKIDLNMACGIQFNPFVTNLFHEINGEIRHYFVPYRLIDDTFETMIVGGEDGQDETEIPTISLKDLYDADVLDPDISAGEELQGSLADYFGYPINRDYGSWTGDPTIKPVAYPHRAYNLIYNEGYQILDIETDVDEDNNKVLNANYDWDYFTRARVYQQRGVVPTVPISDDVLALEHAFENGNWSGDTWTEDTDTSHGLATSQPVGSSPALKEGIRMDTKEDTLKAVGSLDVTTDLNNIRLMPHDVDTLGINMNDFLINLGIMRVQINNAKTQPRYADILQMRYKIFPQDARLQRPEYINTEFFNVTIEPVTQTSAYGGEVGSETAQGNITSQGWGSGQGLGTSYTAQEWGIIMSLMVIKPKAVYEGGLNKMWVKDNRFDFPTPELANLPDVEVKQYELSYEESDTENDTTFGYQGIFEEFRTMTNEVVGKLRPSKSGNLTSYTLARYWEEGTPPVLNKTFTEAIPDQDRILQYTDEPCFVYFIRSDIKTALPLPLQSEPAELSVL